MFETMRKVFGPIAVSVIVGAIALVFVFSGVFDPGGTGGAGGNATAAVVNGDAIPMREFMREYQQRIDFYQNLMKGKADPNLLKNLGIRTQVLEDLVRRKLLLQEAERMGFTVSDEEVRDKIREMPYFKDKDGRFNAANYTQVLNANQMNPAAFEDMIREDLMRGHLVDFMRNRIKVSDQEIEQEFKASEDRRQIDYVVLTRDTAKKQLAVTDKEVDELLKNEAGLNAAKLYYEQNKMDYMKPLSKPAKGKKAEAMPAPEYKNFDDVKRQVAVEVIKERRTEEISKINRDLANQLLAKAKAGDLKSFAKSKGLEMRTSEKFNRLQGFIPGVGEAPQLLSDAFAEGSVLAKEPKLYELPGGRFLVAQNLKTFKADSGDFSKERARLENQVATRKSQQFYEQWMTELRSQAKVKMNKELEQEDMAVGG